MYKTEHEKGRLRCQTSPQAFRVREERPPHRHPSSAHCLEPGLDMAQPLLLLAGRGPSHLQ